MLKIQNALNQPFMTDDFMRAFFDIFNIQCKEFKPERSLFNQQYQSKDRPFNGGDDFFRNYDQKTNVGKSVFLSKGFSAF